MTGTRIDKWLWAARFFKTRTLAARACELGRVEANDQPVKPSREVRVGEFLRIRTEGGEFAVEVLLLAEMRGPASVAQTLYRETEESKEARRKAAEERRAFMQYTPAPAKRPSKRDRRKIHKFREDL
jgi:ribosome-associated heat shock protein Hsp15